MGWGDRFSALALLGLLGCPRTPAVGYEEPPAEGTMIVDPVTRERCEKGPTTPAAVYADRTYYFCGPHRAAFLADPAAHLR